MAGYQDYIDDAIKSEKATGIPAPIVLAQLILESGAKVSSGLARNYNNLFGIKGTGTAGSVYLPTKEHVNGREITINGKFKKFNNPFESFLDHARILQLPRYQKHLTGAKTLEDWAKGIKAGGYATDKNYVGKLLNIIDQNNLDQIGTGNYNFGSYAANLKDNPISGETGSPTTSGGGGGIFEKGFLLAGRSVAILVLFIIGIILLIQAFPVEKIADPVVSTIGKVAKPVGAINKVRKKLS
jgi:Mannosyl-glycoprotein endo-beta-N-acetylglucosaminidase